MLIIIIAKINKLIMKSFGVDLAHRLIITNTEPFHNRF